MVMPSDESSIAQVVESYRASVYSKDVDAFAALYRDDLRVFDMWGRWSYEGSESWRTMAEDWFGSLGEERVDVKFEEVRTIIQGNLCVLHAFLRIRGTSAQGEKLRTMSNRITWALQKQRDGAWKILHEHTSAPADFETAKVMLQR